MSRLLQPGPLGDDVGAVEPRTETASVERAGSGGWAIWSRPPLLWLRLGYLTLVNKVLSGAYRFVRSHYRLWHWSSQHYSSQLDAFARLHAYLMCAWAKKRVPAYGQFLRDNGHTFRLLSLSAFPETTKENYVKRYDFAARCRHGRVPVVGTLVDESAGSSGTAFNWLRSSQELRDVHLNTSNWIRFTFPTERLLAINAFSMGAWATGTNMGIALSRTCMVKSTGPDITKIVDTIETFGDGFDYLITAYPPFLKHIVDALDARGLDWTGVRVYGLVGGEGMTEALRDHLERRLVKVRSGYGASDIQVGIAGETDLSVWVRKLLVDRADVRAALLGGGDRVPMVFQYNPLENYIEINTRGETVVTVNNLSVLSPKLRYNVGDEGATLTRAEVLHRLSELGIIGSDTSLPAGWASPFFFLYGRRDSTISYMGANIYPTDVEYGLYRDAALAAAIESFCLELEESPELEARPVVHVQVREGAQVERDAMAEALHLSLVDYLAATSRDFAESLREDPSSADIRLVLHEHGTGPFAGMPAKIKNTYVVTPS
jgi:phenylacetate-coenzyme A ligase PaaK-like adenylate-forming protein